MKILLTVALIFAGVSAPAGNTQIGYTGSASDGAIGVQGTSQKSEHVGNRFRGVKASNLPPNKRTPRAEEFDEPMTVVTDAGAEAVFRYSRNCFAPEDQEFECIYDPDPENPLEAREDDPAQMTPAEFNSIMHTEFAQLHVTGSGLDFQPKSDGIIGLDFILATNPEPHIHHTQLFDIPITIRATPVHYLWNMGDGNTIHTTDPGKHYPNQTLTHLYEEPGTYTVSLTTTWAGHFSIGDGTDPNNPWYPVAGTITTTETSEPITHREYKTKLVHPEY